MGDHIVRRGVAGGGARRSEPRPTAELSKRELQGLIGDHDRAEQVEHADLEPELELGGDAPARLPNASTPRLLAHTMRREPTPDGMPATARPSTGPRAPLVDRDVSTIAMPRLERPAEMDLDGIPGPAQVSDTDHTTRHRATSPASNDFDDDEPLHRDAAPASTDFDDDEPVQRMTSPARSNFDNAPGHRAASPAVPRFGDDAPCPAAADDFDAGHPVTDLALAARGRTMRQRQAAVEIAAIPPTPRIDRDLAGTVPASRQVRAPSHPRAPAGRLVRVLPISLGFVVALAAAYLLLHSRL